MVTRRGDRADCLFCARSFVAGKRGEDVSSSWYAKHIGQVEAEVVLAVVEFTGENVSHTVRSQTMAAKSFRLSEVCPDCNRGWMSEIENEAKSIVLPMSRADNLSLGPDALRALATWGQLKAICWDALHSDRLLPGAVCPAFRQSRPLRFAVTAAHVTSDAADVRFLRHHGLAGVSNAGGTSEDATRVFRAGIKFGQLMIITAVALDGRLPVELLRERVPEGVVGVWPPVIGDESRVVDWPPSVEFGEESWRALV